MSTEITLYPKEAKKDEIINYLLELGYVRCKNLFSSVYPKGSAHLSWFEEKDYISIDGVEVNIYPNDDKEFPDVEWVLHTRTRSCSSSFDKEYQNKTIKKIRSVFGGDFFNDSEGKNRYNKIDLDKRPPVSRGIFNTYFYIKENLEDILSSLPKDSFIIKDGEDDPLGLRAMAYRHNPQRILYNSLIPFLVSCIEHFFSRTFQILLQYDTKAQYKLTTKDRKIDIEDVIKIKNGLKSLEHCISEWYSFQNIDSIGKAFKEWFNIDIRTMLRKRKKIKNRIIFLEKEISQLILFRHGIVHHYAIDRDLKKEDVERIVSTIIELMRLFMDQIEKSMGIKIKIDDDFLWY